MGVIISVKFCGAQLVFGPKMRGKRALLKVNEAEEPRNVWVGSGREDGYRAIEPWNGWVGRNLKVSPAVSFVPLTSSGCPRPQPQPWAPTALRAASLQGCL